jgi:hypothetical protein
MRERPGMHRSMPHTEAYVRDEFLQCYRDLRRGACQAGSSDF